MTATIAAAKQDTTADLAPFSLKDAPSFIEAQFPVGRLSAETYKERKANLGQTLTALGSYWKGRKPLILCRAAVLGCLLPATRNPAKDLEIFLKLMGMDDTAIGRRLKGIRASDIEEEWSDYTALVAVENGKRTWRPDVDRATRDRLILAWLADQPYARQLTFCLRPEELDESLLSGIWSEVNAHLGTAAGSLPELVRELGIARFGHPPKIGDSFCGGGSIPFEAARVGCDVYASDLNPIAGMLTWGAFNIVGGDRGTRAEIENAQRLVASAVNAEIARLGMEHDEAGNRAKAYLYCLETRCPKTGWIVPMLGSFLISKSRNVVAKLVPDELHKRYDIEIHSGVSAAEIAEAANGTVRDGRLVHPMNPERSGVDVRTIRGDYKDANGLTANRLRMWTKSDIPPRPDDIFQERLYCIQWIKKETIGKDGKKRVLAALLTMTSSVSVR